MTCDGIQNHIDVLLERGIGLHEAEEMFRYAFMHRALERTKGNRSEAAQLMKIHRNSLLRSIGKATTRQGVQS